MLEVYYGIVSVIYRVLFLMQMMKIAYVVWTKSNNLVAK